MSLSLPSHALVALGTKEDFPISPSTFALRAPEILKLTSETPLPHCRIVCPQSQYLQSNQPTIDDIRKSKANKLNFRCPKRSPKHLARVYMNGEYLYTHTIYARATIVPNEARRIRHD